MEYILGIMLVLLIAGGYVLAYHSGKINGERAQRDFWVAREGEAHAMGRERERAEWLSKQPEPVDEQAVKRAKEQAKAFNELMTYNVTQAMKGGKKLNESDD